MTVAELPENLTFVSDSHDADVIADEFDSAYDSFFVGIGEGEYTEIWGMHGIVPYNDKPVYRVL